MRTKTKSRFSLLLVIVMAFTMLFSSLTVFAAGEYTGTKPMGNLIYTVFQGTYTYRKGGTTIDMTGKVYKLQGGGTVMYNNVFNTSATVGGETGITSIIRQAEKGQATGDNLFGDNFENLKTSSKKAFIGDMLTIANAMAYDTDAGYNNGKINAVTSDTVNEFIEMLQDQTGMGTALLAELLQNTKPDFVTANRLYEPFSGVVGTILGIISILIMALLGITMALDLAFITIPALRLALGADGKGEGGKDDAKLMSRLISQEARKAVEIAENGDGGGGQGEGKQALGIYFKKRWKGLVLLGVCLLYLIQGQIYSLVGWIIDLLSGFLS